MDPDTFDLEIGVPVTALVSVASRVKAGQSPAATVARTFYHGPCEGLGSAWAELDAGSPPRDIRQPRTSGSATSRAQSRALTRPLGARSSTGLCFARAAYSGMKCLACSTYRRSDELREVNDDFFSN